MDEWPVVSILLITYARTQLALRTVKALQERLDYPALRWHIADDGSPDGHIPALKEILGEDVPTTDAQRKGVARSMNLGMKECLLHGDYILWMEDDWELGGNFNMRPAVQLLVERPEIGMVRFGYISPGLEATLISAVGQLWWRLKRGPQFTFTGHASLRHRRFCEAYGPYKEGLAPGETELWMCQRFIDVNGPDIALPVEAGAWGYFGHIGGESLKNVTPEG